MKNGLLKWIAGLSVAVCQSVSAVPITDTVTVGTQEWAQVNLFTNVSWHSLNAQCPGGVCTLASSINGYDLAGWTWASVDSVQALFNSYTGLPTPSPGAVSAFASTWAPAFLTDFFCTYCDIEFEYVSGASSSVVVDDSLINIYAPYMYNRVPPSARDSAVTASVIFVNSALVTTGAWFVRETTPTPAPLPATLTLFGLGLASLWMTRRKSGAKV